MFKKLSIAFTVIIYLAACSSGDSAISTEEIITGTDPSLPQMIHLNSGELLAWWTESIPGDNQRLVAFSTSADNGKTFSRPVQIKETAGINAAHGESLPVIVEREDSSLVLVFSSRNEEAEFRFAGSVKYIQSFDSGKTWVAPEIIHKTDTNIENSHSFVAATLLSDGEVGSIWLDGRHKLDHSVMYFAKTNSNKGFTEDYPIGGPTCQCCKNSMLLSESGTLHIAYRGLVDGERDIMYIQSNDNGATFTEPVKVSNDGWEINACPHSGPAIAKSGDKLHVFWYSLAKLEGLFYTVSSDNGNSFAPKIQISDNPMAKYPQIEVIDDAAYVVWDELIGNGLEAHKAVKFATISGGQVFHTEVISSPNRDAWAPNIIHLDAGKLMVTWVEMTEEGNKIKRTVIDEIGGPYTSGSF